jgi:hypothetical protein
MALGVFADATKPYQTDTSYPDTPSSLSAGNLDNCLIRIDLVTAKALRLPFSKCLIFRNRFGYRFQDFWLIIKLVIYRSYWCDKET